MFSNTPGDITVDTESGLSTAVVTWTEPTVMDNSGDYTVTSTYNSGYRFPLGTTTVRYYAWDASGNNVTYAFNVTVEDNESPVLSNTPSAISAFTSSGQNGTIVTWTEPTASDNSGVYTITSNYNSGYRFQIGTTRVVYTVLDASGNTASYAFNVTVIDNEASMFSDTPGDITVNTESGLATASVTWTEPTVTDNSGVYTVTSNYQSGESFGIGITQVIYSAWDEQGNYASFSFNITVIDNESPLLLNTPSSIIADIDFGQNYATVTWTEPTVTDNSGFYTLTSTHSSGSQFSYGVTTVTYTAVDESGNTVSYSFNVTVQDVDPPVFTNLVGDVTQSTDSGLATANVTWTEPTVTDKSGIYTVTSSYTPGSTFSLGITTVTYSAVDWRGNTAEYSFDIDVVDDEPPTFLTTVSDLFEYADLGLDHTRITWTVPTAIDNSGVYTITTTQRSGSDFQIGDTNVTYTAVDSSGNTASFSFIVTINETLPTLAPPTPTARTVGCPPGQLACPEGTCIPEDYFCDNRPGDCLDYYDESVEAGCAPCAASEYRCPEGLCITKDNICDDYPNDCLDNYDESDVLCLGTCRTRGTPENGIEMGTFKYNYKSGENATFGCNFGYTMVGSATVTCVNGVWSDDLPFCYESCTDLTSPRNGAIDMSDTGHGGLTTFACNTGYQESSIYPLECVDGSYNGSVTTCSEINECDVSPCQNGATCIDGIASFTCTCAQGWNGTLCDEDINECLSSDLNECHANSVCSNLQGSYNCTCLVGFRGDGLSCLENFFFSWGLSAGDSSLRVSFDNSDTQFTELISETIRPPRGYPFFGEYFYSIYFTENGLFLFIRENDDKYGFPYPYEAGFAADSGDRIVAPFWADIDLSTDVGNVYFQVYDAATATSSQLAVLADASDRVRQTDTSLDLLGITFEADWMLLVTWEKVPAFRAQFTGSKPNTFQAAILTDGVYSFAIFNYREEEMLWDTNLLQSKDVLIGYNSGAEMYRNVQQENPPFESVNSRYRPDQVVGNTGQNGRWVLRLETNDQNTKNYKNRCLQWYNNQPDPSTWSSSLGTCPCSFEQARTDSSYGVGESIVNQADMILALNATQYGLDESVLQRLANLYDTTLCIQSTIPTDDGASMQCCYRSDESLIIGYEGPWSSTFIERQYYITGQFYDEQQYVDYLNEDLLPRYYCCTESQDPSFCDLYYEKRPAGTCNGYEAPQSGWLFGDPHMRTMDGYQYTFNGKGEYILAEVDDGLFVLQARMGEPLNVTVGGEGATIFTGVAAMQTDSAQVEMVMNAEGTDFSVLLNGNTMIDKSSLLNGPYFNPADRSFYLELQRDDYTSPITGKDRVVVYYSSGISVSVAISEQMLDIIFLVGTRINGQQVQRGVKGLLGVWNGDFTDDFLLRDGQVLTVTGLGSLTDDEIFSFGESWRVQESETQFTYPSGTSWSSYNDLTFQPTFLVNLLDQYAGTTFLSNTQTLCNSDVECLYDTLATGNTAVGMNTLITSVSLLDDAMSLANYAPNITSSPSIVLATVGEEMQYTISANDAEGDTINYALYRSITNATITKMSENAAVFKWTPANAQMTTLGFVASDERTASTVFPEVRLCSCQNGGTCNFNQLVDNNDIVDDRFSEVTCTCPPAYTGDDCSADYDACLDNPCYPGVTCKDNVAPLVNATCGPCPFGLIGDGFKCYDFDECQSEQDQDPTKDFCSQVCTNTLGSYECGCYSGYDLHPDERDCIDIDECDVNPLICGSTATCQNTIGGYNCTCNEGYEKENVDSNVCIDINECVVSPPCSVQASCTNTIGSFMCDCDVGYEGDGITCTE
ncbi:uncharacterized protein [Amphiura filiformis]|uniref:uncharacterized protein n=1 Tax=Amphiura filiformis TaxID=82378 RepID=UPI003B21E56F